MPRKKQNVPSVARASVPGTMAWSNRSRRLEIEVAARWPRLPAAQDAQVPDELMPLRKRVGGGEGKAALAGAADREAQELLRRQVIQVELISIDAGDGDRMPRERRRQGGNRGPGLRGA